MSRYAAILKAGSNNFQTTAEHLNRLATDFFIDGVVGSFTNTAGVAPMTGGFGVNAQGTPNNTVAVTLGSGYVTATPGAQASQRVRVWSDANENITIAANSSGGTVYDWIYLKVDATTSDNPNLAGDNVFTLATSRSTSSVSDNGTPPTYGKVIAVVTVANSFVTITNGNISDRRVRASVNAVSSAVNPTMLSNPYKFHVNRTAAWTSSGGVVGFDTAIFDTGGNVDIVTNKGRFTAPIAGFYYFSSTVAFDHISGTGIRLYLQKNGTEWIQGVSAVPVGYTGAYPDALSVSGMLQLAASDYVEVNLNGPSSAGHTVTRTWFQGFLISAT